MLVLTLLSYGMTEQVFRAMSLLGKELAARDKKNLDAKDMENLENAVGALVSCSFNYD